MIGLINQNLSLVKEKKRLKQTKKRALINDEIENNQ